MILPDRQVVAADAAVDLGARDGDDTTDTGGVGAIEHVEGALGVRAQRPDRVGPRGGHVGLAGEVIDDVEGLPLEQCDYRAAVGDVGSAGRAVGDGHLVAGLTEMRLERSTDETGAAGDQRPHGRGRTARGCWYGSGTSR